MSYSFSFDGLSGADAVKVLKKKAREIENLEISHQLITPSDKSKGANLLCDKPGECVDRNCDKQGNCEIKGCEIRFCACKEYMYENNVLPNRRDLSNPHYFQKTLKCGSDKNGIKRGIYAIICIKDDCKCKGVIYIGCAVNTTERIGAHIRIINGVSPKQRKRIHRHFQENNHDLSHFRYAILEEVKYDSLKPKEILVRENHFMDKFGTFKSWFGCNDRRNKVEEEEEAEPEEPSASKKAKLTSSATGNQKGVNHREKDHSIEKWCIALALRNLKDEKGTTSQITQFSRTYFKDEHDLTESVWNPTKSMSSLKSSVNSNFHDHEFAKKLLDNWFVWANEAEQRKKKEKNVKHRMEYVFGLNTGILDSINDELFMEYESGSFDSFMRNAEDLYYCTIPLLR